MDTITIPTLAEAIALVSRHDACGDKRGCSVAESLATNSPELDDIIGECPRYRNMRPLRDALSLAREAATTPPTVTPEEMVRRMTAQILLVERQKANRDTKIVGGAYQVLEWLVPAREFIQSHATQDAATKASTWQKPPPTVRVYVKRLRDGSLTIREADELGEWIEAEPQRVSVLNQRIAALELHYSGLEGLNFDITHKAEQQIAAKDQRIAELEARISSIAEALGGCAENILLVQASSVYSDRADLTREVAELRAVTGPKCPKCEHYLKAHHVKAVGCSYICRECRPADVCLSESQLRADYPDIAASLGLTAPKEADGPIITSAQVHSPYRCGAWCNHFDDHPAAQPKEEPSKH